MLDNRTTKLMIRIGGMIAVDPDTDCWRFTGAHTSRGYGKLCSREPHRIVYEFLHEIPPAGYIVHHVCETRDCVNPWHLSAIPETDHRRLHTSTQTACARGHEYTEENTYFYRNRRQCRTCQRMAVARYATRKKGQS